MSLLESSASLLLYNIEYIQHVDTGQASTVLKVDGGNVTETMKAYINRLKVKLVCV